MRSSGKTKSTPGGPRLGMRARRTLKKYAAATWRSLETMTDPKTGLPADYIEADGTRAGYTSPTNIASLLWSTLAAGELGLIASDEAQARIATTLRTLSELERFKGQYFNWYEPASGQKLIVFPPDNSKLYPFLSSVDNGWLAAALIMVRNALPRLREQAAAILEEVDLGFYYDSGEGHLRNGYWPESPPHMDDVDGFTAHHYGALNSEARIASYVAIARRQVPEKHYFQLWRTFPDDWDWQEMKPQGVTRNYLGVDVYEGHYRYRGMEIVPSWGGSMFEALMVPLLVPEEDWAPRSWRINHPRYVQAQIEHGLDEAGYGYWGFSPCSDPAGGYREYGVDPLGLNPDGYSSDEERTTVDYGFPPSRPPKPLPDAYGQGIVTPHAGLLALDFAPDETLANLAKLRRDFDVYDKRGGFYDAVNVRTGVVARRYLALDQGMIMMAIANALLDNRLQAYFAEGEIEAVIHPLIAQEAF